MRAAAGTGALRRAVAMVIKVQCACGACDEWAMIELQGEVKMQSQLEGGDEDGAVLDAHNVDLGEFCGDQASGKASFTIGYHRLEGKEIKLKKPLAILEAADDDGQQGRRTLKVVGVVRRKFHFKVRESTPRVRAGCGALCSTCADDVARFLYARTVGTFPDRTDRAH